MTTSLHISFNGQCEQAFEYYQQHLGANIESMLTVGDSPMASQFPEDWQKKIINAGIELDGMNIGGGDVQPNQYQAPAGFNILLRAKTAEKTKAIFDHLAFNSNVILPLQKTFWSSYYGIVVDQFGVPWKINCLE